VRYDDVDCYFHTNHGLYLTYAAECAAGAALSGTLKNFSGNTEFRNIRKMTNLYLAETLPGDRLTVSTWEDTEDPCALYFIIRKDGSTVFRSKFIYYPAVNDYVLLMFNRSVDPLFANTTSLSTNTFDM